jgi:hypothetical protein
MVGFGYWQFCGSGRMFLGPLDPDPDPDPLVRGMDPDTDSDPSIIKQK